MSEEDETDSNEQTDKGALTPAPNKIPKKDQINASLNELDALKETVKSQLKKIEKIESAAKKTSTRSPGTSKSSQTLTVKKALLKPVSESKFLRPRPRLHLVPNAAYLNETGDGFIHRAQKKKRQERAAAEKRKAIASCEESGESNFLDKGFRSKSDDEEVDFGEEA